MSNQIIYSKIKSDLSSFVLNYKIATGYTDPSEIDQVIQEMDTLAKNIIKNLNEQADTDTSSTGIYSYISSFSTYFSLTESQQPEEETPTPSSYYSLLPSVGTYFTSAQSQQPEETPAPSSSYYSLLPSVSSYFTSTQPQQPEGLDKTQVIQNIQQKMETVHLHLSSCIEIQMSQPLQPTIFTNPTPSKQTDNQIPSLITPIDCKLATGFENLSNNCWANALLSMIVHVPNLRKAYETVADYYAAKDIRDGYALQDALIAYDSALEKKLIVPQQFSQDVRLAFHNLFPGDISKDASHQEDAHKALQLLMKKYEEILREDHIDNSTFSDLYCNLKTTLHFLPIGEPKKADRNKLQNNEYIPISKDNTVQFSYPEYEIFLPLKNQENLRLNRLLENFFLEFAHPDESSDILLVAKDKVQEFTCTRKTQRFEHMPNEFFLTLESLSDDQSSSASKNTTPIEGLTKVIRLPEIATYFGRSKRFELDAFIAHCGDTLEEGRYSCFKKIQGKWIEVNNQNVSFVNKGEIKEILQGQSSRGQQLTSYMHHYSRL